MTWYEDDLVIRKWKKGSVVHREIAAGEGVN